MNFVHIVPCLPCHLLFWSVVLWCFFVHQPSGNEILVSCFMVLFCTPTIWKWNLNCILSKWIHRKHFACFAEGDNFCRHEVVFLEFETFQKWGLLLKERICSLWEQILFFNSSTPTPPPPPPPPPPPLTTFPPLRREVITVFPFWSYFPLRCVHSPLKKA